MLPGDSRIEFRKAQDGSLNSVDRAALEEKVIEENATLYAAHLASIRDMVATISFEFIFEVIYELVELYQCISRQA